MNVRTCRKCGRMFNYIAGLPICPVCREALEAKFQDVKNYLRDNPGAGMNEISEACEVDKAQINQWIREDRLELSADSAVMINCESCGASIRSGRFCDKCRMNMTNSLNKMAKDINAHAATSKDKSKTATHGFITRS